MEPNSPNTVKVTPNGALMVHSKCCKDKDFGNLIVEYVDKPDSLFGVMPICYCKTTQTTQH